MGHGAWGMGHGEYRKIRVHLRSEVLSGGFRRSDFSPSAVQNPKSVA